MSGTSGNDTLSGLAGNDPAIRGFGGDDTINTNGGNDYVDGGAGNDTIHGGDGDDASGNLTLADLIHDFTLVDDKLQLGPGLAFADLSFNQSGATRR